MSFYQWEGNDLLLSIYIQPRSSRNSIVGIYGHHLKIKITAAPIEGQANAEIKKLLSKLFGVAQYQVILIKGQTHREKRFRIQAPKKLPEFIHPPEHDRFD